MFEALGPAGLMEGSLGLLVYRGGGGGQGQTGPAAVEGDLGGEEGGGVRGAVRRGGGDGKARQ